MVYYANSLNLIPDDYQTVYRLCSILLKKKAYSTVLAATDSYRKRDSTNLRINSLNAYTYMRNPLYHWTHLELRSVFGVNTLLKPETAKEIYDECTAKLRTPEFSARGLMKRCNVKVVCTTDDPIDSLEYHIALKNEGFEVKVLPTWRPDKAMAVENAANFRAYIEKLAAVSGVSISRFADVIEALRIRHKFFESVGCKLSDHDRRHLVVPAFLVTYLCKTTVLRRPLC